MVRIRGKALGLFVPAVTDVLIRGESCERFKSLREVIGHQERMQMLFQVVMGLVVILFHGGVFARAVHAFDLAIGPGMVGFGQPMGDAILTTATIKDMMKGIDIALAVGELNAVISSHRVDFIGHGGNHVPEELGRDHFVGCCMPLGIGTCACPIDGDTQGELAFFRAHFGDIAMEGADGIALARFLLGLVPLDGWQAADAVPLQTTVER
jgi:hypothetical protein